MSRHPARIGAALGASLALALTLGLSGCASTPSVDLGDAQDWLAQVQAAESDGPGAAGTAAMLVTAPDDASEGDASDDVVLDFANPTVLVRADAQCYGGGTVTAEILVEYAGSTAAESFGAEIPCDEVVHPIPLSPEAATSAAVSGTGIPSTYLHVTLIQEMTVEE